MCKIGLIWIVGLLLLAGQGLTQDLADPVRIFADGKPVDTEVGHAAPFACDFDGDGDQDLLVGQFKGGCLWIYHNEGSNRVPELTSGFKFKQGAEDGCVPYG